MRRKQVKNRFPQLDETPSAMKYYGFDGRTMTLGQWSSMVEGQVRAVARTYVRGNGKTYWVSTVLLGIDYSFGQDGKPLIFETMVFESGPNGIREVMDRYHTLDQARKGHRKVVKSMRLMLATHAQMFPPLLSNGRKS